MSVTPGPRFADLGVRIASAVVLIAIALIDFWHGGIYVTALVALSAALMIWEYRRIVLHDLSRRDSGLWAMILAGVACVVVTGTHSIVYGFLAMAAGLIPVAFVVRRRLRWMLPGLIYITLGMAFLIELRRDPVEGFPLVLWLVTVVIAADVGGYFAGRLIGGPKLWPKVSPKKTWAGMMGGLALSTIAGTAFYLGGHVSLPWLVALSVLLALASQAGDLAESALKRHFGVKDSSAIIPGHGGLLDRFDGLLGALWAYGLILFVRDVVL
jgi:phosphatidate cytidylyltransferase